MFIISCHHRLFMYIFHFKNHQFLISVIIILHLESSSLTLMISLDLNIHICIHFISFLSLSTSDTASFFASILMLCHWFLLGISISRCRRAIATLFSKWCHCVQQTTLATQDFLFAPCT